MADSENSRSLPKILCAGEFLDATMVENQPSAINRRNLLPAAARILPMLLDEVPSRTVTGPFHIKELWPRWFDRYQRRLAAERESRALEGRLLKITGGRPCIVIETDGDAALSGTVSTFDEIRQLEPRIGAEAAASARRELRRRRQAWNAADERLRYSVSLARAREIAEFEGIAGRILISLQPRHLHEIAAKLHYMLVNFDPELRKEEAPWSYLRCMLREIIQPQWSVIDPQSHIRWLQARKR